MTTAERIEDPTVGIRRLPIWGFLVIAATYLGIVQGLAFVLTRGDDVEYGVFRSSRDVWTNLIPALLAAFVFVYAVVAVLGWWRPVFIDHRSVRRWVWIVPGLMFAACVAGMYYAGLADKGAGFVVTLAIAMLLVGFGEEGMFRGIGVTAFRVNGYPEWRVALWTSLVFGLAHATNLFQEGPRPSCRCSSRRPRASSSISYGASLAACSWPRSATPCGTSRCSAGISRRTTSTRAPWSSSSRTWCS